MDKRIIIFGGFTGNNLGDMAILISMINNLKDKCSIHVPSKQPQNISYIKGIKTFKTLTAFIGVHTIHEIKNTDVVVIGGGGLFYDHNIYNPFKNFLFNILLITFLAKIFDKKVYIFSTGANHLESKMSKIISNIILNYSDFISVRDLNSKRVLQEISRKQIEVYHDPAFLLDGISNDYVNEIKNKYLKNNNTIVFNIHKDMTYRFKLNIPKSKFFHNLISILDDQIRRGYIILLFSTELNNIYLNRIIKYSVFKDSYVILDNSKMNPQNMIELLRGSKLIVGSQLHSLILATIANVPSIGFIYDKKVLEFLKFTNQENQAILLENLYSLDILRSKIEYVIKNNEAMRFNIQDKLSQIRKSSYKNFVKLNAFIQEQDD